MAGLTLFDTFLADLAAGKHDLGTDVIKLALTNVTPTAGMTELSEVTQIAAANGYAAGGAVAATTSSAQTAGVYKLILGDVTFTAAGGDIGPFRYIVAYNSTATDGPLIGWSDYGLAYIVPSGQPFVIDFDDAAGALTLAPA